MKNGCRSQVGQMKTVCWSHCDQIKNSCRSQGCYIITGHKAARKNWLLITRWPHNNCSQVGSMKTSCWSQCGQMKTGCRSRGGEMKTGRRSQGGQIKMVADHKKAT